jgi:threonine/homoserine/homoserine lactone efflux protein
MIILDVISLITLGIIVGLSGAMIPGPLLAFTVFDTLKKKRVTGHMIIAGHAIWELGVILLILAGFGWIITKNQPIIYVIGGLVLALTGGNMIRNREGGLVMKSSKMDSSFFGGLFYTAFNPTQPPWWATAGLALLLKGIEVMDMMGVIMVTLGHWASDFTYYIIVSFVVNRQGRYTNPYQKEISLILGVFIILLSIYFLQQGLQSIL